MKRNIEFIKVHACVIDVSKLLLPLTFSLKFSKTIQNTECSVTSLSLFIYKSTCQKNAASDPDIEKNIFNIFNNSFNKLILSILHLRQTHTHTHTHGFSVKNNSDQCFVNVDA